MYTSFYLTVDHMDLHPPLIPQTSETKLLLDLLTNNTFILLYELIKLISQMEAKHGNIREMKRICQYNGGMKIREAYGC